jgi:hypothetical protein
MGSAKLVPGAVAEDRETTSVPAEALEERTGAEPMKATLSSTSTALVWL